MAHGAALKTAWECYLDDNDAPAFRAAIAEYGEVQPPLTAEYPELHRVADVVLDGHGFRIVRYVHGDAETLFVVSHSATDPHEQGVPYSLSGLQLRRWIEDESRNPSKDPTDWDSYL